MFQMFTQSFGISLVFISFLVASDTTTTRMEKDWALGAAMRIASIPFSTDEGNSVTSFVPLMFYDGPRMYLRGMEGGFKLYNYSDWYFHFIGRLRFFDIPAAYQNQVQGDNVLWGLRFRYQPHDWQFFDIEPLIDLQRHFSTNFRYSLRYIRGYFLFEPYVELKLKTASYNSYYYGFTQESVKGGGELSLGIISNYHVLSNFYLYGTAKITFLDRPVRNVSFIRSEPVGEVFFGLGFSNDRGKQKKLLLGNTPYVRVAYGWATPSDLSKILKFKAVPDTAGNNMSSVFYGLPLTDNLVGLPLDLYLTGGFVWHWKSDYQPHSQEIILAVKLYYTIPWPIRWRLGAAEGLSYANKIPFVENTEMHRKGYKPSNLLNFLDFSLDLNLGDIFGGETMQHLWLGYSIHHRSAIFEKAQQFGRIRGGSNFQTAYLQWHFN